MTDLTETEKAELNILREKQQARLNALNRYRFKGSKPKVYQTITVPKLSILFKVSERTIKRWIQQKRLDPTDIMDIISKYNNRYLLDHRRNATQGTK